MLDITIPISDEQGVMNIVELTTASNQTNYVSIDGSIVLKMRFTSQTYNPVTGKYANTYEDGTMTIKGVPPLPIPGVQLVQWQSRV